MNKYYNTNFKSLVMPKNPCVAVTVIKLSDQQKEGKVKLKKSSANPEITNGKQLLQHQRCKVWCIFR